MVFPCDDQPLHPGVQSLRHRQRPGVRRSAAHVIRTWPRRRELGIETYVLWGGREGPEVTRPRTCARRGPLTRAWTCCPVLVDAARLRFALSPAERAPRRHFLPQRPSPPFIFPLAPPTGRF